MINRRSLLLSPLAAALLPRRTYAAQLASLHGEIYRQLGVRPLINAAGTYTTLTGSLLVPQAREAMTEASRYFVPLIELQHAAGARIAKLVGVPAAMISSGGAGSILLATAACIAGKDPEKIKRLPDTTGMKNEVVMVRQHRSGFDHACRTTGAKIVEVETAEQLKSAIGSQTAMLYWVNIEEPKGKVSAKEFLAAGKSGRHSSVQRCSRRVAAGGQLECSCEAGLRSCWIQRRQGSARAAIVRPAVGAQRPDRGGAHEQ